MSVGTMVGALTGTPGFRRAPSTVKVIAQRVAQLQKWEGGTAFVSADSAAEWLGKSRSTARRALRDAQALGLIVKVSQGWGRRNANGWRIAAADRVRPADTRPPKTAGQRPRKLVTGEPPILEVPSFVNLKTRDYSTRGPAAREKPDRGPQMQVPRFYDRPFTPEPACEACGDRGWVLTSDGTTHGTAEACICRTVIDTRQARTTGRPTLTRPPRPAPPAPDSVDHRPLAEALARIQRRAESRQSGCDGSPSQGEKSPAGG